MENLHLAKNGNKEGQLKRNYWFVMTSEV